MQTRPANIDSLTSAIINCDLESLKLMDFNNVNLNSASSSSLLYLAAQKGYAEITNFLVEKGASVTNANEDQSTPLHAACVNGHFNTVKLLIGKGADVNATNKEGLSAFHLAVKNGNLEIVQYLLAHGANLKLPDKQTGKTALHIAAENGKISIVNLFKNSILINKPDFNYEIPLFLAVKNGHFDVVKMLVEVGTNLNQTNKNGESPLFVACKHGRLNIAKVLVKNGAYLSSSEDDCPSLIYVAAQNGHLDIIRFLIEGEAPLENCGESPLCIAAKKGHIDIVDYFLSKGIDVNDVSVKDDDFTLHLPLIAAATGGHVDIIKHLIAKGAKLDISNDKKQTALHVATQNGHIEAVKILLDHSANTNLYDREGNTPLFIAAKVGNLEIFKMLLTRDADVVFRQNKYCLLMDLAKKSNNIQIIDYLETFKNIANENPRLVLAKNCALVRIWPSNINSMTQLYFKGLFGQEIRLGHISLSIFVDDEETYISHWPQASPGIFSRCKGVNNNSLKTDIQIYGEPECILLNSLDIANMLDAYRDLGNDSPYENFGEFSSQSYIYKILKAGGILKLLPNKKEPSSYMHVNELHDLMKMAKEKETLLGGAVTLFKSLEDIKAHVCAEFEHIKMISQIDPRLGQEKLSTFIINNPEHYKLYQKYYKDDLESLWLLINNNNREQNLINNNNNREKNFNPSSENNDIISDKNHEERFQQNKQSKEDPNLDTKINSILEKFIEKEEDINDKPTINSQDQVIDNTLDSKVIDFGKVIDKYYPYNDDHQNYDLVENKYLECCRRFLNLRRTFTDIAGNKMPIEIVDVPLLENAVEFKTILIILEELAYFILNQTIYQNKISTETINKIISEKNAKEKITLYTLISTGFLIENKDNSSLGEGDKFYNFLDDDIIPYLAAKYFLRHINPIYHKHELLLTDNPPTLRSLNELPMTYNSAYIRSGDQLYYVDKDKKLILPMDLTQGHLQRFDITLGTENLRKNGTHHRCLNDDELKDIFKITNHYLGEEWVGKRNQVNFKNCLSLIAKNKYNPRYLNIMHYLMRLYVKDDDNYLTNKSHRYLHDAWFTHDLDLVGIKHIEFIIRACEELLKNENLGELLPVESKEEIKMWLISLINQDNSPIIQQIRQLICLQLLNCPNVLRYCCKILEKEWDKLSPTSQQIAVLDYIIPFSTKSSTAAKKLIRLLCEPDASNKYHAILSIINWSDLLGTNFIKLASDIVSDISKKDNIHKSEEFLILFLIIAINETREAEDKNDLTVDAILKKYTNISNQFVEFKAKQQSIANARQEYDEHFSSFSISLLKKQFEHLQKPYTNNDINVVKSYWKHLHDYYSNKFSDSNLGAKEISQELKLKSSHTINSDEVQILFAGLNADKQFQRVFDKIDYFKNIGVLPYILLKFCDLSNAIKTISLFDISAKSLLQAYSELYENQTSLNHNNIISLLSKVTAMQGYSISLHKNKLWICNDKEEFSLSLSSLPTDFVSKFIEQHTNMIHEIGLPTHYFDSLSKTYATKPRIKRTSSFDFFKPYQLNQMGIIPLITYNQSCTMRKSLSIQSYLDHELAPLEQVQAEVHDGFQIHRLPDKGILKLTAQTEQIDSERIKKVLVDALSNHTYSTLDLSNNKLNDNHVKGICEILKKYNKINILKLSHNAITAQGFDDLLTTLKKNPSVKYLLLDHNHISGKDFGIGSDFRLNINDILNTEESIVQQTGLVHIDLSMNYIPKGFLPTIVKDNNVTEYLYYPNDRLACKLNKSIIEKCGNEYNATHHNQNKINNSIVIHSEKLNHQSADTIFKNKTDVDLDDCGVVYGLFTNDNKPIMALDSLNFGGHTFLLFERIDPEFGQKELIKADLVFTNPKTKSIRIRINIIDPSEFLNNTNELKKLYGYNGYITNDQFDVLLKHMCQERDTISGKQFFYSPEDDTSKVNCFKWAVQELDKIGIQICHNKWLPNKNLPDFIINIFQKEYVDYVAGYVINKQTR